MSRIDNLLEHLQDLDMGWAVSELLTCENETRRKSWNLGWTRGFDSGLRHGLLTGAIIVGIGWITYAILAFPH